MPITLKDGYKKSGGPAQPVFVVQDAMPVGSGIEFVAVPTGSDDGIALLPTTGRRLMGISIRESAGTPANARIDLHHGQDATGPKVLLYTLAANGYHSEWFGPEGINIPNGLYYNRFLGSTEFVIYYEDVT